MQRIDTWHLLVGLTIVIGPRVALGAEVVESEPNDTPAGAATLQAADYGMGTANGLGDVDYWRMQFVDAGSSLYVLVDTRLSSSNIADSDVTVFASDGVTEIAFDDNSGPFFGSALANVTVPESGPLFIRVRELSDGELDDYLLIAAALLPNAVVGEQEPNDSPAEAEVFTGRTIESVNFVPDDDYYAIPALTGDLLNVIVDDDPQGTGVFMDSELIFYAPDGTTVITRGDNFEINRANAIRTVTATEDGTYYARITNAGTGSGATGTYRIMGLVNGIPVGADTPAGIPCDGNCPGQEPEPMNKGGCSTVYPAWWALLLASAMMRWRPTRRLEADL